MSERLYNAAQCRELDRIAIEEGGVSGFELMCRAGDAALQALLKRWPRARALSVYCGKGNNAGDGYVVARLALDAGLRVELLQLGSARALGGDAALARDWAAERGVEPVEITGENVPSPQGDVVVDALLGTGVEGPLRAQFGTAVAVINDGGRPVLAIDIPTGVRADTGGVAGSAVKAALTVTFIGRKIGLATGAGVAAAGEVVFADLGVGPEVRRRVSGLPHLDFAAATRTCPLPERDAGAYKQALGHVVVLGGDYAMGGAPLMAAESALRVGAGLVSVLTRPQHRPAFLARRPEVMVADADDEALREQVLSRATTLLVGPGLGRGAWGAALLRLALAQGKPVVIDADGLNLLAELDLAVSAPVIITPHPGEAATLLGCSGAEIAADRLAAARLLAERVGGVSVLKGAGTVLACVTDSMADAPAAAEAADGLESADTRLLGICAHGNPGMASAGMGDVLAGVVAGLWTQGMSPAAAATVAVPLHSLAADRAALRTGERSLLATDLLPEMMQLLRD